MTSRLTDFIRSTHPNRKAFVEQSAYRSRAYTYREIEEGTRRIINGLRNQSVKEGDRVILWGENSARWAMTFYACLFERVVVVPIDASFSQSFVNKVKEITEAKLVLCDQNSTGWNLLSENELASVESSEPPAENSLMEIVFTSGSTGEPKGVMITHGNVLSNLLPIRNEYEKYKHFAIPFGALSFVHLIPLSHLFGQIMGLFIPQMLSGTLIFSDPAAPQVVRAVKENRASAVICVPRQLSLLQNYFSGRDRSDPTSVRYKGITGILAKWWRYRKIHREFGWKFWAFISGGAALSQETEKFWSDRGFAVIQGYGLTETAPSVTITHPFKGIEPGSVGKKLPGVEIKIADDGEILVRGPNVSPGYYRNPSASDQLFEDGWLRTGDFGQFDEKGNLRLLGRKKEVIISASGLNVYPEDVEAILNRDSRVRESAVVGRNCGGTVLVHAVLLLEEGVSPEQSADIMAKANANLENFQQIQSHEVWSGTHLPRTSTGKIKRVAIAAGITAEPTAESPSDKILQEILAGSGKNQNQELGLSSLDRVELLVALEGQTGVSIDDTAFAQARTAEDIRKLIREPVAVSARARGAAASDAGYPSWRWPLWWPVKAFRNLCWYLLVFPLHSSLEPIDSENPWAKLSKLPEHQ